MFVVRTAHIVGDRFTHRTTLARDRAEAIRQAERIGPLDERESVSLFLDGRHTMVAGQVVLTTLADNGAWTGVATIYRVDEP